MAKNSHNQIDLGQKRIESLSFFIAFCAGVLLFMVFFVSEVSNSHQPGDIRLESRINPNSAPISSLMRLPGIGLSKANAIVEYRENYGKNNDNSAVFNEANDLQQIKGIGPKTVENIKKWLKFE